MTAEEENICPVNAKAWSLRDATDVHPAPALFLCIPVEEADLRAHDPPLNAKVEKVAWQCLSC